MSRTTGIAGFQEGAFPEDAWPVAAFPLPATDRAGIFYLVAFANGIPSIDLDPGDQLVSHPYPLIYSGQEYILVCIWTTAATRALFVAAAPQPATFDGSVLAAQNLLRANDAMGAWWNFDAFLSRVGARAEGATLGP